MKSISEILFVISNGLMIPVLLLLLYFLCRAVWIVCGLYRQWQSHGYITAVLGDMIRHYSQERMAESMRLLDDVRGCPAVDCLRRIVEHKEDSVYCEHELADYQVEVQRILSQYRMLVKFGPMLGLMGTLIPMGPALVGLAAGDIGAMARNMQVAFATTVVGMLVAGVGLAVLQLNQRFFARSLNDLEFVVNKITAR
ncbi:MAG: MotA/TolQ/ExbB proton channel family protein [Alistipes sp.]|nr:MotA/TolQ/ExbB proton channel family protein [Alistipes sp.]